MKHDALKKSLKEIRAKLPKREDKIARIHQDFVSKCSDEELRRMIEITEDRGEDLEQWTPEDAAYLAALMEKYLSEEDQCALIGSGET